MRLLKPKEIARLAAQAASDKKAADILILDVSRLLVITDYFVICSGGNVRQVKTIAEKVEEELKKKNVAHIGIEGQREARWVLLDYGDVVVHIFNQEERDFYQIERLWKDAPQLEWEKKKEGRSGK